MPRSAGSWRARNGNSVRRILLAALPVLAFALLLGACGRSPKTLHEVAESVLTKADWLADSKECPAKFVPQHKLDGGLSGKHCDGELAGRCFSECEAGEVSSCYWLAYSLQLSKLDDNAAQALYQRSCRLGEPSGCTNRAARILEANRTDAAANACAASTFAKTCAVEDAWGCTMHALALHRGLGTVKDDQTALRVIENSCAFAGDPREKACLYAMSLKQQILEGETP